MRLERCVKILFFALSVGVDIKIAGEKADVWNPIEHSVMLYLSAYVECTSSWFINGSSTDSYACLELGSMHASFRMYRSWMMSKSSSSKAEVAAVLVGEEGLLSTLEPGPDVAEFKLLDDSERILRNEKDEDVSFML